jgi:ribosome-associated translation inhibitor RaiA
MQFQFNSDNHVHGSEALAARVEQIARARLSRVEARITRVEVHVGDENGARNVGADKRCSVEIRPTGMDPITASQTASSIETAVVGATDKVLAAFDRQVGKRTTRKGH